MQKSLESRKIWEYYKRTKSRDFSFTYISAMSARKNQSKFQINALLLVETLLIDFYALRWWKKKLLNLALLYYKHSFLPVKKSCQSIRINKFLQLTLSKTIQVTAKALDFWPKRMIWRVISQSLYSCHTSTGGCKNVYDFLFLFPRDSKW